MTAYPVAFAIPGDILTPTGGYAYDRRLIQELRAQGFLVDHIVLGSTFPDPTEEDSADAATKLSLVPEGTPLIIDGLALGALDPRALDAVVAPIVALVHHPLALEGGLSSARREHLVDTERENLARATHVVVTSPHTAELLVRDYGVATAVITVAKPGTEKPGRALPAAGKQVREVPLILSVGIQVPRKGHDVLLQALSEITHLPWQAVIAGSVVDKAYGQQLEALRDELGLGTRVRLAGFVSEEELAQLYRSATVFVLATRFEGYGMVFNDAMAHGLPIVSCQTGAVPDTVAEGAGVLVPPEQPSLFADAVRSVLEDSDVRHALAEASARAGRMLMSWEESATRVAEVLSDLARRGAIDDTL